MSLPHPNIVFTPLTTITAQDHNNQMANVASLADGTGVNDGAIVGSKLKNSTVTADKIDFTTMPLAEKVKVKRNDTTTDKPVNVQCGFARISVTARAFEATTDIYFPKQFKKDTFPVVVCTFTGYTSKPDDAWTDTPLDVWGAATMSALKITNSSFKATIRRFDGAWLEGTYYFNWIAIG